MGGDCDCRKYLALAPVSLVQLDRLAYDVSLDGRNRLFSGKWPSLVHDWLEKKTSSSAGTSRPEDRLTHGEDATTPVETDAAVEQGLVEKARLGSTQAFGELVRLHQDRVLRLCMRLAGNRSDAEDLAQETFIRAFRAIDRFDDRARFYTWVSLIVVNLAISANRRLSRRPNEFGLDQSNGKPVFGRVGHIELEQPADRLVANERSDQLWQALDAIDPEYRAILVLREMESLSYEEIQDVLKIPLGTVKSRVHRARLSLRDQLKRIMRN